MKIMSQQECIEWMEGKFAKDSVREIVKAGYPRRATHRLPVDTGKKTIVARNLVRAKMTAHK